MLELKQGDCLCAFGLVDASVGLQAFWSHLRFAGSHDRQPGSPALDPLDFVCVCSSVWRPNSGAYSRCGRMRLLYVVDLSSCLCGLIFLLRKPNDWFALFCILSEGNVYDHADYISSLHFV